MLRRPAVSPIQRRAAVSGVAFARFYGRFGGGDHPLSEPANCCQAQPGQRKLATASTVSSSGTSEVSLPPDFFTPHTSLAFAEAFPRLPSIPNNAELTKNWLCLGPDPRVLDIHTRSPAYYRPRKLPAPRSAAVQVAGVVAAPTGSPAIESMASYAVLPLVATLSRMDLFTALGRMGSGISGQISTGREALVGSSLLNASGAGLHRLETSALRTQAMSISTTTALPIAEPALHSNTTLHPMPEWKSSSSPRAGDIFLDNPPPRPSPLSRAHAAALPPPPPPRSAPVTPPPARTQSSMASDTASLPTRSPTMSSSPLGRRLGPTASTLLPPRLRSIRAPPSDTHFLPESPVPLLASSPPKALPPPIVSSSAQLSLPPLPPSATNGGPSTATHGRDAISSTDDTSTSQLERPPHLDLDYEIDPVFREAYGQGTPPERRPRLKFRYRSAEESTLFDSPSEPKDDFPQPLVNPDDPFLRAKNRADEYYDASDLSQDELLEIPRHSLPPDPLAFVQPKVRESQPLSQPRNKVDINSLDVRDPLTSELVEAHIVRLAELELVDCARATMDRFWPGWTSKDPSGALPSGPRPPWSVYRSVIVAFSGTGRTDEAHDLLSFTLGPLGFPMDAERGFLMLLIAYRRRDVYTAETIFERFRNDPDEPFADIKLARRFYRTMMLLALARDDVAAAQRWCDRKVAEVDPADFKDHEILLRAYARAANWPQVERIWESAQMRRQNAPSTETELHAFSRLFTCLLEAYDRSGVAWPQLRIILERHVSSRSVVPDQRTYYIAIRSAARSGDLEVAHAMLGHMESQGISAEERHFDAILAAIIAHNTPTVAETAHRRVWRGKLTPKETVAEVRRIIREMKAREVPISAYTYIRISRFLRSTPNGPTQAVTLCQRLIAGIPAKDEPRTIESYWAHFRGPAATDPVVLVMTELVLALSANRQFKAATDAFRDLIFRKGDVLKVDHVQSLLAACAQQQDGASIEMLKTLWDTCVRYARQQIVPIDPADSNSALPPHQAGLLTVAMDHLITGFFRCSEGLTEESMDYVLGQWSAATEMGFGFDAKAWSSLAESYAGLGRIDRAFQILNDIVLWRLEVLSRRLEMATGKTIDGALVSRDAEHAQTRHLLEAELVTLNGDDTLSPGVLESDETFQRSVRTSYGMVDHNVYSRTGWQERAGLFNAIFSGPSGLSPSHLERLTTPELSPLPNFSPSSESDVTDENSLSDSIDSSSFSEASPSAHPLDWSLTPDLPISISSLELHPYNIRRWRPARGLLDVMLPALAAARLDPDNYARLQHRYGRAVEYLVKFSQAREEARPEVWVPMTWGNRFHGRSPDSFKRE